MILDAQRVESNRTIQADLVVVGSGPAALTLASELAATDLVIVVLESGPPEHDAVVQSFNTGRTTGDSYPPLESTRQRQVGGASNMWHINIGPDELGVRYVPLDPIDFKQRDWVPHSGWPIEYAQLTPFYERAHMLCKLRKFDYAGEAFADAESRVLQCGDDIRTTMFQFGPRDVFVRELREQLTACANVTICYNADVTEIEANETGTSAQSVHVATRNGQRFTVWADRIVLAAGGIENARLLLLSDRTQKHGLGNQHDVIGRYFMDHPLGAIDRLRPNDPELFNRTSLYDLRRVDGAAVMGKFQLSEQTLERERLLSSSAMLFPRPSCYSAASVRAAVELVRAIPRRRIPESIGTKLLQIATGFDQIVQMGMYAAHLRPAISNLAAGGWSLQRDKSQRFATYDVIYQVEQGPDPENRVVLDDAKDSLGRRKVRLLWRFKPTDTASHQRCKEIFARSFAEHRVGELELSQRGFISHSTHHHMGATRMSNDPRLGVVDANCKVHGIDNLFIAGSSVFTTGGYANPTLTIVALAIRLADHLKSALVAEAAQRQAQKVPVPRIRDPFRVA